MGAAGGGGGADARRRLAAPLSLSTRPPARAHQVIYFSAPATLKLAELAQTYPLDCCSYMGLDMNRRALRIELYSDVMLAMGGGLGLVRGREEEGGRCSRSAP